MGIGLRAVPDLVELQVALPQVLDVGENGGCADDAGVLCHHHCHGHLQITQGHEVQVCQEAVAHEGVAHRQGGHHVCNGVEGAPRHLVHGGGVQHHLHTLGALGVQGHGQHIVEGELREVQLTLLHQQLNGRLLSLYIKGLGSASDILIIELVGLIKRDDFVALAASLHAFGSHRRRAALGPFLPLGSPQSMVVLFEGLIAVVPVRGDSGAHAALGPHPTFGSFDLLQNPGDAWTSIVCNAKGVFLGPLQHNTGYL
mmetsp:Transcript_9532/g.24312  ORF Transcript_9532/g.24312 Transcript_9532/m.24312 type:complete len:256 (+) Transcript_9532:2889-3656(+)